MQPLEHLRSTCDYCRYEMLCDGEWKKYLFRKPTSLVTNVEWEPRRCNCPGNRHASSLIGDKARGKRHNWGQGKSPTLHFKHAVPTELQLQVLRGAKATTPKGTFVLDLFAGTQSLKLAADLLGVKYVSVDILPTVKVSDGYVKTDIVRDLDGANLKELIREAAKLIGEKPKNLLLMWLSPDCRTFSQAQTLCPLHRRHRDYTDPSRPAISQMARHHDHMISHLVSQLPS
jgi:hypothetical protein